MDCRRWVGLMAMLMCVLVGGVTRGADEMSWDVSYEPGKAEGRMALPTDASAVPTWRLLSFAEPAKATLAEDYLQIATGSEEAMGAGVMAYQMTLDAPAERMTLVIEMAVSEMRSEHFGAVVLLGSGKHFAELKIGDKVALLSPGAGGWTQGDYTTFTKFWVTVQPKGDAYEIALYHESKPEPLQVKSDFAGPIDWIRFGDTSSGATVNGVSQWRSIRWKVGQAVKPAWAKSSAAADQSGTIVEGGPVQVLNGQEARDVSIQRLVDTGGAVSFRIDSKEAVKLAVVPRRFAIEKGASYWVNATQFEPAVVKADRDGVLELTFTGAENCWVQVERTGGDELVPNGSFEQIDARDSRRPAGWEWRVDKVLRPTLMYGHELIEQAAQEESMVVSGEVALASDSARSGSQSLRLVKRTVEGEVIVELAKPMTVEAGRHYLAQGFYRLLSDRLGGAAHLLVELRGEGKANRVVRDALLNPLVDGGESWRRSFFTFDVPIGYDEARLSVRLRGGPIEMLWDDISLRVGPSKLAQLPAMMDEVQSADVYGADEVRWRMSRREPWVAKLDNSSGVTVLQVNDEPVGAFGFVPGPYMWPTYGLHRQFGEAGVSVQWLPIYSARTQDGKYGQPIWLGDGSFDFSFLETQLTRLLQRDINAKVMLYLNIDPYPGFVENHPEAGWINWKGQRTIGEKRNGRAAEKREKGEAWNFSYTAEAYRRESGRMLEAMGAFLADSPVGKAVMGVHLVGGNDGQWFSIHSPDHADRSQGALLSYRQWLKERYAGEVAALREAWEDQAITFETVQFPQEAARSPEKLYFNPKVGRDRRIIDWNRFTSEGIVETLDHLGQQFKRGIGRGSLVTIYYNDMIHGQLHPKAALAELLSSEGLDGAISVVPYGLTREVGRTGTLNSLVSSFHLHNKLFLAELDYRTNWAWLPADAWTYRQAWGVPTDVQTWVDQLRRDLGHSLTLGGGAWLYGLGGNAWLGDDYLLGVAEAMKAAQLQAELPAAHDAGQVAVFVDEQVLDYSTRANIYNAATAVTNHAAMRVVLSQSGLSWDRYLLSDITHPDLPDYKVMIFLSSVAIDEAQIQTIEHRFQKDGRVLVFMHAVGMGHPDGFERAVQRLSGIQAKVDLDDLNVRRYHPTVLGQQVAAGVDELITETRSPLFWVTDEQAQGLATLTRTDGKIGLAVKQMSDWTGVYVALPGGLSVPTLRYLADLAGVQPIGPAFDATYAGRGMLVIHALHDGVKTLRWQGARDVLDLASGQIIGKGVDSVTFEMKVGQTRWFRLLEGAM